MNRAVRGCPVDQTHCQLTALPGPRRPCLPDVVVRLAHRVVGQTAVGGGGLLDRVDRRGARTAHRRRCRRAVEDAQPTVTAQRELDRDSASGVDRVRRRRVVHRLTEAGERVPDRVVVRDRHGVAGGVDRVDGERLRPDGAGVQRGTVGDGPAAGGDRDVVGAREVRDDRLTQLEGGALGRRPEVHGRRGVGPRRRRRSRRLPCPRWASPRSGHRHRRCRRRPGHPAPGRSPPGRRPRRSAPRRRRVSRPRAQCRR